MRLVGDSEAVASVDIPLRQNAVAIGSARGNTVLLPSAVVSSRHARVRRRGRDWIVEDLDSVQGTYVNGIRTIGRQVLRPGDVLAVGPAALRVVAEDRDPARRPPQPPNRRLWLGVSLFIFLGLAAIVAFLARAGDAIGPLALMVTATPAVEPEPAATATAPALVTVTAAPPPSATPALTATPTSAPTATPTGAPASGGPDYTLLEGSLATLPEGQALAVRTAVARLGEVERRDAIATLAGAPTQEVGALLERLLTPTPAPPTGRIVYGRYSHAAERYDVLMYDVATGVETLLLTQASQPALSPDGGTVAYRSWQPDALGLYAATADGSLSWLLTREVHPDDRNPRWSPDGSTVAFASFRYGDGRSRVYTVPGGGGIAFAVCDGEYVDWAPDGGTIAFKGCIGGSCGIMLIHPDGSGQRLLTTDAGDSAPAWSPDGRSIAFHSGRDGSWDIYAIDVATDTVRRLTAVEGTDTMPVWSPDGRYLAFRSDRDGEWAIWIAPVAGAPARKLCPAPIRAGDEMIESFSWVP